MTFDDEESSQELPRRKKGKQSSKKDDEDFNPDLIEKEDDFDIEDAASDNDSLPSDYLDSELDDVFEDLPDTPPKKKRGRPPKSSAATKKSGAKSTSTKAKSGKNAKKASSTAPEIVAVSDDDSAAAPSEHFSDDDMDVVLGDSSKRRKTYSKSSSATKPMATKQITKPEIGAQAIKSTSNTAQQSDIKEETKTTMDKKRKRVVDEDGDEVMVAELPHSTDSADSDELPPSPKKPKLNQESEIGGTMDVDTPGDDGARSGKALITPSSVPNTIKIASKDGTKSSPIENIDPYNGDKEALKATRSDASTGSVSPTPAKSNHLNKTSINTIESNLDTSQGHIDNSREIENRSEVVDSDSPSVGSSGSKSTTTVKHISKQASSAKQIAASKPTTKPTSASSPVAKSHTHASLSPHKKLPPAPLNAPFKPVSSSSSKQPTTSTTAPKPGPTNRPLLRMGLSRASKPLHSPVK